MKKDSLYVYLFTDCTHLLFTYYKVMLGGNNSTNSISQERLNSFKNCFTMSFPDLFHPAVTDSFSVTILGILKCLSSEKFFHII